MIISKFLKNYFIDKIGSTINVYIACVCTILLIASFPACESIINRNDIYYQCPKGDTITFETFRRFQRILKSDNRFFFLYDLYTDEYNYDYLANHWLVCDNNLILKGATIAPHAFITYAKNDTLFGWKMKKWSADTFGYRRDFPSEIKFQLEIKSGNFNGFERFFYNEIDSIEVLHSQFSVKMYIKIVDKYGLYPYEEGYLNTPKTIELPISSLHFSRSRDYIGIYEKYDIKNELQPVNDSIIEKLYIDIWRGINKKNHN